ncbi:MAG: hypothetical protein ACJ790_14005 [Myxococcaceae bacterium]
MTNVEVTHDWGEPSGGLFSAPYDAPNVKSGIAGGAVMGLVGGLAFLLLMMFSSWISQRSPLSVLRLMGSTGYDGPISRAPGYVWGGLAIHLAVSAGWGAFFGLCAGRNGRSGAAIPFGALSAMFVWWVMTWWVIPMSTPRLFDATSGYWNFIWFCAHLLYGFFVGFAPMVANRIYRRLFVVVVTDHSEPVRADRDVDVVPLPD